MRRLVLVLAAALVTMTSCDEGGFGPPSPGGTAPASISAPATPSPVPSPRTVAVGTPGFRYEPAAVILRPGERVVLVLRNTDTRAHNLTVDRLNIQMTANAGETVRLPLEAPPAGSFVMYCSLGGHLRAGHRGRLEVR